MFFFGYKREYYISDFVNFDDCIGKITSKFLFLVLIKKKDLKLIKNRFHQSEKIKNVGNWIYDYAHSFFGEDF